jgi:hypothetical protein
MAAPAYSSSQSDSSAAYDPSSTVGTAQYRGLIWLVATAFFMQARDLTIVNTAAPSIAHALAARPIDLKTALTRYVLTLAVCIPAIAGSDRDRRHDLPALPMRRC